jgi:hypothetical protein
MDIKTSLQNMVIVQVMGCTSNTILKNTGSNIIVVLVGFECQ